ncbi:MAG: UDP-N-acetylmuramoyl-tripeptide--D-alanyl-D-alanine ligase [Proteobacteria bacterium]|nr:UDP-N-acetylmuramoyl-tripeptide--D-alanyl-D-alanine ligase [Pseudomonadota bacterium]
MSFSWTTLEIAKTLGLSDPGRDLPVALITTDSRHVVPGALFVAIKGDTFDGHDFIPQAIEKGAVAVLCERFPAETGSGPATLFKVPSTMTAIRALAHRYRLAFKIPLIAVVGAVGKTTTKELIASILSGRFTKILKTEGSQNGFLGIPLTLLNLRPETQIGVIEIGIDEIGAMEQHLELVEPTHVVLTRTGPEHLHQLKTVEIAAEEELKAFDHAVKKKIPLAINLSDPYVKAWHSKHETVLAGIPHPTYSLYTSDQAEFTGSAEENSQKLAIHSRAGSSTFACPLPGEHHAHNLLAAIVVSRFFGLTDDEIERGISSFKTAYGRTELYSLPGNVRVIGDYYNSNPTSLEAALKLLTSVKGAPSYHAVLGDMLELGDQEESFHRSIAGPLADSGVTRVWLYGPRMRWLQNELEKTRTIPCAHFDTHDALLGELKPALSQGAQVLVKGSRGMKMEKVLKGLLPGESAS